MTISPPVDCLLAEARSRGIAFSAREGRLFHVPRSIPPVFADRVRPHKEALIRALSSCDTSSRPSSLVAAAQSAFAGVDGPMRHRGGTRHEICFSDPATPPALDEPACRCCYRVCWWSLDPKAALLTCGYCHPPAPHLNVIWHGLGAEGRP